MKLTKTLHVFGDSFSTPNFCVQPCDSFWGLAGKYINADVIINYSQSGMSFEQILHMICNKTFNFKTDYFLIGIPPIARVSIVKKQKSHTQSTFDLQFAETVTSLDVINEIVQYDYADIFKGNRLFIANYNHAWLETKTCDLIFLLYNYLKQQNAKFMILNLTIPFYFDEHWPVSKNIMTKLKLIPECVLFNDTYFSTNKEDNIKPVDRNPNDPDCWFGHHGPEGNYNWFNKLLKNKIKELQW